MSAKITIAQAKRLLSVDGDDIWTTSLVIAEQFERPHKNVLQSLDDLVADGTLSRLDFKPAEYSDEQGKPRRALRLNERGFLIAMPFIGGRKSRAGQVRLVDSFLSLRADLKRNERRRQDDLWQQKRIEGKVARLALTDAVQEFVTYAISQGSSSAEKYYMSITKMEYKALFMVESAVGKSFRDTLTAIQSSRLTIAEDVAQRALREGITKGMHYKEIYQLAKRKVEELVAVIGKSLPGDDRLMLGA